MELKDKNFICIPSFMRKEHGLKGNDMIIASIIYGFSQDRKTRFTGSLLYLQEWTGLTKHAVIDVLKNLVDKKIIIKNEEYINKVKFCSYSYNFTSGEETTPVVKNNSKNGCKNFTGGGEETTPNNIDIDNKDNNKESIERNAPTQAEKKKSSSAKQQKKDIVLDSNNRLAAAADPASRYGKFMKWAAQTITDCYSTMAMPTENQLMTLINTYGNSAVIDIFETIENRQDIRGKYKSLYLTAKNWLKRDEQKKQ